MVGIPQKNVVTFSVYHTKRLIISINVISDVYLDYFIRLVLARFFHEFLFVVDKYLEDIFETMQIPFFLSLLNSEDFVCDMYYCGVC